MRKLIPGFCFGFLVLTSAALAQAPTPPKPGPEYALMTYFTGTWEREFDFKPGMFGPGGKFKSQDKCEWFAGEFQVVCRSSSPTPLGPKTAMGIIGYNSTDKVYTYYAIDSHGLNEMLKGARTGSKWTFLSKSQYGDKTFHSRYSIVEVSPTATQIKWEISEDSAKWMTIMEGKSTKAGA